MPLFTHTLHAPLHPQTLDVPISPILAMPHFTHPLGTDEPHFATRGSTADSVEYPSAAVPLTVSGAQVGEGAARGRGG